MPSLLLSGRLAAVLRGELAERAPVLVRKYLAELRAVLVPALEHALRLRAAGMARVALDEALHDDLVGGRAMPQRARELRFLFRLREQRLQGDHGRVAAPGEFAVDV